MISPTPHLKVSRAPELSTKPASKIRRGVWRNRWRQPVGFFDWLVSWDPQDERAGEEILCHRRHESEAVAERVARAEVKRLPFFARPTIKYLGAEFFPEASQ